MAAPSKCPKLNLPRPLPALCLHSRFMIAHKPLISGEATSSTPSETSTVVTPPPKGFSAANYFAMHPVDCNSIYGRFMQLSECLGLPISPQSQAKHRREHYLVKDKQMHFRCLSCGDAGAIDVLKSFPCSALDDEMAKDDATSQAASLRLAQALQAEHDEELIGRDLEAELLAEQLSLEELLLQAEEGELQRLLAQEEADLLQAKMESLESRTESVGELMPPPSVRKGRACSGSGAGSSTDGPQLQKLPAISAKRTLEHEFQACKDSGAEAKRPCTMHEAEQKQPQRAADVHSTPGCYVCAQDAIYCLHSNTLLPLKKPSLYKA